MIAVGTDGQNPQHASTVPIFPYISDGNELPTISCDLGDINFTSTEIDQIFQSFGDFSLPPDVPQMQVETEGSHLSTMTACDFSSMIFGDLQHSRDVSFTYNVDNSAQTQLSYDFNAAYIPEDENIITPSYDSGITPRTTSPTWSESSGSTSTGSISGTTPGTASQSSKPVGQVPRHKRPSHKRAEIKRRDKIKTCLDDIKDCIPSLKEKGKLSESAILAKAADYVRHLKDACKERENKAEELRREIECLSTEIHSFQENLPAGGLKEEPYPVLSLDELYLQWREENSQYSSKFFIFSSITSSLFESFKTRMEAAKTLSTVSSKAQEWQASDLALPALRKQILKGMLMLSREDRIVIFPDQLQLELGPNSDLKTEDAYS